MSQYLGINTVAFLADNSSPNHTTTTNITASAADSGAADADSTASDINGPTDKTIRTEPGSTVPELNATTAGEKFEPAHNKTYNKSCVTNESSVQLYQSHR